MDVKEQQVRLRAAETILDRGVRLKMPAPSILKLLRLNRLNVKPQRAGTILEFAKVVTTHQLENCAAKGFAALEKEIEPCCRCIAISLLNRRLMIKWFTSRVTKWLIWQYKTSNLIRAFLIIFEMNSAANFSIITKFYVTTTKTMMTNLGQ